MKKVFIGVFVLCCLAGCKTNTEPQPEVYATNPAVFADVPDVAMVRAGDVYYMASTTMHMNPGLPIMKSKDLVNWELVSYAYDKLVDNDMMNLENGQNCYGRGSWAPSIRYHNGVFYASTFSATSGKTHIYTTTDPENEPWVEHSFEPSCHDHSLFFEDDKVYLIFGGGDIRIVELESDLSGIKADGLNQVIVPDAGKVASENLMLHAEGSQMYKYDGKYYLFNICWPQGGMRTVVVHRSDNLTGPYEGRVVLQDRGIAQGCIIDTPEGNWYAYLFRDYGAVGRMPYIVPMKWENGWPVLGVDGVVPDTLDIKVANINAAGIVASDEFDRKEGDREMPLAWQWNHNPDHNFWSLTDRPGYFRLTTDRVVANVTESKNILTQRTFGPTSSAEITIETAGMKDGDYAGLVAFQRIYGFIGVRMQDGQKSIVMMRSERDEPVLIDYMPFAGDKVAFKINCDFTERNDKALFYFKLEGNDWTQFGDTLQMRYSMPHFMGYRFGLFNFATKEAGGYVDFDYYRVGEGQPIQ